MNRPTMRPTLIEATYDEIGNAERVSHRNNSTESLEVDKQAVDEDEEQRNPADLESSSVAGEPSEEGQFDETWRIRRRMLLLL